MLLRIAAVTCGGIAIGYLYGGYKYYGTINPYKQTKSQLIKHRRKIFDKY